MLSEALKRVIVLMQRPRAVLALAALVTLPALGSGLFLDDFLHLLTLRGEGFGAGPLDLFRFATGDAAAMAAQIGEGPYPWYTWPELKIHFFRPLSSATMLLDFRLFGERYPFYHLHSTAWYVLLVWGAFLVYRRVFSAPLAGLCLLLYALDDGHLIPAMWWSNRNAIVSAAPALLGLAAHLRWREDGWKSGLPLSLLGYGAGLLGGETALGILGYTATYELLRRDSPASRMRALTPGFVLAGGYLLAYKGLGHGVKGSGVYFDPIAEWPLFLAHAPGRLLDLAGAQFFSLPVELAVIGAEILLPLRAIALTGLTLLAVVLWQVRERLDARERHAIAWLGLGALISAVPGLATFPSGRLLVLPSLGACAVVALLLYHGLGWAVAGVPALARRTALGMAILHVVMAPLAWVAAGVAVPVGMRLSNDAFHDAEIEEATAPGQRVFCLAATDPYTGFYPVVMRRYFGYAAPLGWQTVSIAPYDHEVTRTGANRFELRVVGGEMLSTPFERLIRSHAWPLNVGDTVTCTGFRVEVLETGVWGPRKIALEFDRPLEDPSYQFLAWTSGRLAAFTWPDTGETVLLRADEGYFAWRHFKKRLPLP